jgi:hypothetical protein
VLLLVPLNRPLLMPAVHAVANEPLARCVEDQVRLRPGAVIGVLTDWPGTGGTWAGQRVSQGARSGHSR